MGATPWYDDRRGQTYGVILFCTIVNFIALFAALMAGDDDPEVVKDFNLAVIQASARSVGDAASALFRAIGTETAIAGLNGFVHKKPGGEGDFYAWDESLPNEETTFYDYPWLESCKRNGTATYGLLIPIILVKILAAFVVYRRAYAEHDTWRAKVAGVAVEAGCFPNEDKVQEVRVNVASVGICLAGLMSLVMSYLHFRTPCWNSELPEYGRD
ncbi:hypothetical protein JL722_14591 [Aureococcus anophagefferens]|nr:hypothetical protein JL722_14591 [Aureococcus anophagefferens]